MIQIFQKENNGIRLDYNLGSFWKLHINTFSDIPPCKNYKNMVLGIHYVDFSYTVESIAYGFHTFYLVLKKGGCGFTKNNQAVSQYIRGSSLKSCTIKASCHQSECTSLI